YIKDQFNRSVKRDDKIYTAALHTSIGGYNRVNPSTKAPDIWYSKDKGSFDFLNYQKLDKWVEASSKKQHTLYIDFNEYPRDNNYSGNTDKFSCFYEELDRLEKLYGDDL
ncbi:MAG: hypothetical protein MJB14_17645, partial [Spirochaetes bacterium]|nr:hypothetical protein [Spirochaetota bacterium]